MQIASAWSTFGAGNINIYKIKEGKCTTTTWQTDNIDIIIDNIINKEKIAMIDDIIKKKKADDYIKQIEINKEEREQQQEVRLKRYIRRGQI